MTEGIVREHATQKQKKIHDREQKRTKPRREVPDVAPKDEIIKVNIDLSETMLRELDQVAILLNISRQAVIKNFIKDGLDRHFMGQKARF
jgi:hypothetical protein